MAEQTRTYRSTLSVSAHDLFAWHANPGALVRLTPPWMNVRVISHAGIGGGDRVTVNVPIAGPIRTDWTLIHERLADGIGFADVQQSGPFRSWRHEHRFIPNGNASSILEDRLTYDLFLGGLGHAVAGKRISRELDDLFGFRHLRTRVDLDRLASGPCRRGRGIRPWP